MLVSKNLHTRRIMTTEQLVRGLKCVSNYSVNRFVWGVWVSLSTSVFISFLVSFKSSFKEGKLLSFFCCFLHFVILEHCRVQAVCLDIATPESKRPQGCHMSRSHEHTQSNRNCCLDNIRWYISKGTFFQTTFCRCRLNLIIGNTDALWAT